MSVHAKTLPQAVNVARRLWRLSTNFYAIHATSDRPLYLPPEYLLMAKLLQDADFRTVRFLLNFEKSDAKICMKN